MTERNGSSGAPTPTDLVLAKVREALETIEFGSILIKIHQGEVVDIETSTRTRLPGRAKPRSE
jgi:hypothetical protein